MGRSVSIRAGVAAAVAAAVCSIASGADVRWINPAGGSWQDGANWESGLAPASISVAVFDLDATYTVEVGVQTFMTEMDVRAGDVTLDLAGSMLRANGPVFSPALITVGGDQASPPALRIEDGSFFADLRVGCDPDESGSVVLHDVEIDSGYFFYSFQSCNGTIDFTGDTWIQIQGLGGSGITVHDGARAWADGVVVDDAEVLEGGSILGWFSMSVPGNLRVNGGTASCNKFFEAEGTVDVSSGGIFNLGNLPPELTVFGELNISGTGEYHGITLGGNVNAWGGAQLGVGQQVQFIGGSLRAWGAGTTVALTDVYPQATRPVSIELDDGASATIDSLLDSELLVRAGATCTVGEIVGQDQPGMNVRVEGAGSHLGLVDQQFPIGIGVFTVADGASATLGGAQFGDCCYSIDVEGQGSRADLAAAWFGNITAPSVQIGGAFNPSPTEPGRVRAGFVAWPDVAVNTDSILVPDGGVLSLRDLLFPPSQGTPPDEVPVPGPLSFFGSPSLGEPEGAGALELSLGQTLAVDGPVSLAGALTIPDSIIDLGSLSLGDRLPLVRAASRTGTFDTVDLPEIPGGVKLALEVEYPDAPALATRSLATVAEIVVVSNGLGCPGDADGDSQVNNADITSSLKNWLADYSPGTGTGPGDANADGLVDFQDLTAILQNWLAVCP